MAKASMINSQEDADMPIINKWMQKLVASPNTAELKLLKKAI